MKKININTEFLVYENELQLDKDIQRLLKKAAKVRTKAYAPYSKFGVGAAILLSNAKIVTGSNQENASYPSGLCAERTAIYSAGANYPDETILAIAIVAGAQNKENLNPIPPCGACRQAIAEYEIKQNKSITIYFSGTSGAVIKSDSVANLLPLIFDKSFLNQ